MKHEDSGKLIKSSDMPARISESGRTIKDRTGEVRMMSCGQTATIIAYRSSLDVDVQFEDSSIATKKSYQQFQKGCVKHPNPEISAICMSSPYIKSQRIGEMKVMNNGMMTTIIDYHNKNNIDIQFEDGTIVRGVDYYAWSKGSVAYPTNSRLRKEIRFRVNMMRCGFAATIIDARTADDIDVMFDDGVITRHKSYRAFKAGKIAYPDKDNRLGETRMMKCGMACTIIAYRSANNIDVKFEDGTRVLGRKYQMFKRGGIRHPNMKICTKKNNNQE